MAFSWPPAQRRGLVFPPVSDCSRAVECKHALMCGAALDTVDTAQAISAHEVWGLTVLIVPLYCFSLTETPPISHARFSDLLYESFSFSLMNGNLRPNNRKTQCKRIHNSCNPLGPQEGMWQAACQIYVCCVLMLIGRASVAQEWECWEAASCFTDVCERTHECCLYVTLRAMVVLDMWSSFSAFFSCNQTLKQKALFHFQKILSGIFVVRKY